MNNFENDRDVLPTWVSTSKVASLPESHFTRKKNDSVDIPMHTAQIANEFEKTKETGAAIELLNTATVEGNKEHALTAANHLKNMEGLPQQLSMLITSTLQPQLAINASATEYEIASLRARIRTNRSDPFAWVELSRQYAIIGEKERAKKAMTVAAQLCKNHRWVSRVAARAFIHLGEPDRALSIINRNQLTKIDPWLVATEMATARKAEKQTKLWKTAKNMLNSKFSPINISELASSVATNEIISGSNKKAKAFFKQSLIKPNQTSLAQAKWAERSHNLKNLVDFSIGLDTGAYEANYWEAYNKKDMVFALAQAQAWFMEEPFSSGPPIAISYIASLLDDYELIRRATERGLKANPSNVTLRLNKVFSWIALTDFSIQNEKTAKQIEDNIRELRQILNGNDQMSAAHAMANFGMLLYRTGYPEEGKARYEAAADYFHANGRAAEAILTVNHLREALICGAPWANEILQRTEFLFKDKKSPATPGAEFYINKITKLQKLQGTWGEKFHNQELTKPANEEACQEERKALEKAISSAELESKFWLPPEFGKVESLRSFTLNRIEQKNKNK